MLRFAGQSRGISVVVNESIQDPWLKNIRSWECILKFVPIVDLTLKMTGGAVSHLFNVGGYLVWLKEK